jgi:hypothetical protein
MIALLLSLLLSAGPQETPAQPAAEVEIATKFQEAAPDLFKEWLKLRPGALKAAGLGSEPAGKPFQCETAHWFEFIECRDASEPKLVGIDVRKTDSILTPFIGTLVIRSTESCLLKRAVPSRVSWSRKRFEEKAPSCLGKTYDECIAGGAAPAPEISGSSCTGGPGKTFHYRGELTLTYRWSLGKWEFQREDVKDPRRPGN